MPHLLQKQSDHYVWITNLEASAAHWHSWFKGLSENFLTARPFKALCLSSQDNADRDMLIAQMQGKFQMSLFDCGHYIHEDCPEQLAKFIGSIIDRLAAK